MAFRASKYDSPTPGTRFGSRVVISTETKSNGRGDRLWLVECDCGDRQWKKAGRISAGRSPKCRSCKIDQQKAASSESFPSFIIYEAKNRAERRGLSFNLTPEYLEDLYQLQGCRCAYTGLRLKSDPDKKIRTRGTTLSVDRIDSSKGYVKGNIQIVHKRINSMKNDLTHEQFVQACKLVAQRADE